MKSIKNIRYILSAAALMALTGLISCSQDDMGGRDNRGDCGTVSIRIALPDQSTVSPMSSRAVASDYDVISDLNIFVTVGGTIEKRLYLDADRLANTEAVDGVTVSSERDKNSYTVYTLDFDNNYWDGIPASTCQFHAVANNGSAMTDGTTIDDIRSMRVEARMAGSNGQYAVPATPNVMFGESNAADDAYVKDTADPSVNVRVVTIGLKRTAAMITLLMDGAGLDDNVEIELLGVALRNVPSSCSLGPGSKAEGRADVSSLGDYKGGPSVARGKILVGNDRKSLAQFQNDARYATAIGGHYKQDQTSPKPDTISDVSDEMVEPMFMFENLQGDGVSDGATGDQTPQAFKRPQGWPADTAEISRLNRTEGVCSYLEVTARYTQYGDDASVEQRGNAVWRFFLGKDAMTDMNVERNTNYRITLRLNRSGIGERDYSWRVDAALKTPEVVGTANNVVGGGGEMFCVEFNRPASEINQNMKVRYETDYKDQNGNAIDFVYAYMDPSGSQKKFDWIGASKPQSSAYFWYLTASKQLWFYVKPLMPGDEGNVTERTCKITFESTKGENYGTVSFTQYKPVTFTIEESDVTDHGDDPDLRRAMWMIEKYYNHIFRPDGGAFSRFEFYADRVDRDAMPWGYTGVRMDKNQHTGFENVYHLVKPKTENYYPDPCDDHIAYSAHYLPTGKGYREFNSDYIDYSNGSCMMHAAMENYFQKYYPYPGGARPGYDNAPKATPDELLAVKIDDIERPGKTTDEFYNSRVFSWCVPSVEGCQIVELLSRYYNRIGDTTRGFDPAHPIVPWVSYWTSNAATRDMKPYYPEAYDITGMNRSFVYQFDMGLDQYNFTFEMDKIGQDGMIIYHPRLMLPRATPIRYRLLNLRPDVAGTAESGTGS